MVNDRANEVEREAKGRRNKKGEVTARSIGARPLSSRQTRILRFRVYYLRQSSSCKKTNFVYLSSCVRFSECTRGRVYSRRRSPPVLTIEMQRKKTRARTEYFLCGRSAEVAGEGAKFCTASCEVRERTVHTLYESRLQTNFVVVTLGA